MRRRLPACLALLLAGGAQAMASTVPVAPPGAHRRGDTRHGLARTPSGERYQLWRLGQLRAGQIVTLRFTDRAHNAVCLLPERAAVLRRTRCTLWSAVPIDRAGGVWVRLAAPRAGHWVLAVVAYSEAGPYSFRRLVTDIRPFFPADPSAP